MPTAGPGIPTDLADARWMRWAACQDAPADALTPREDEAEHEDSVRLLANRDLLCYGSVTGVPCPVQGACLAWALEDNVKTGIAGGLTAPDRDALAGHNRRVAAAG